MTRIFVALAGVVALGVGGPVVAGQSISPPAAPRISQAVAAKTPEGLQTVTLKVRQMSCAACTYILRRTLEGVDGVISAKVSYGEETAVVTYDPARCGVAQLIAATAGIGFPSTAIE